MSGIDTDRERNIFEYRGRIDRPIPDVGDPLDDALSPLTEEANRQRPTDGQTRDATLLERGRILQEMGETDRLIDEVSDILAGQMAKLALPVTANDTPGLSRAIRQLGGTDTITFDLYERARNLVRNAQLAALCVDPVHLVFAPSSDRGPVIPRIKTRTVTCEEAGDPNLFAPPDDGPTIALRDAIDQQKQMTLLQVLKLTWLGLAHLILRAAHDMVNGLRLKLKKTIVLRPLARLLVPIVCTLRKLIIRSERAVFGHPKTAPCKQGKPDPTDDDTERDADADDLATELNAHDYFTDREPPDGTGCPVVIPPDCVEAAQTILDFVRDWALNDPSTHGEVNPAAFLLHPIITQMIDLQETGKFLLVSQDQSELTAVLDGTTHNRPEARNRWGHPFVRAFRESVPTETVTYTRPTPDGDPMIAPLAQDDCT